MIFQEPKVEFVSIELSDNIATSTICNTGTTSGGGQYCINSQMSAQSCPDNVQEAVWDTTLPEECREDRITL